MLRWYLQPVLSPTGLVVLTAGPQSHWSGGLISWLTGSDCVINLP